MSAIVALTCGLVFLVFMISKALRLYIFLMNVATFVFIMVDKFKSINQFYRTKETDFYIMFLFGGWFGGLIGMIIFRHKTRKTSFLVTSGVASVISILCTAKVWGWI